MRLRRDGLKEELSTMTTQRMTVDGIETEIRRSREVARTDDGVVKWVCFWGPGNEALLLVNNGWVAKTEGAWGYVHAKLREMKELRFNPAWGIRAPYRMKDLLGSRWPRKLGKTDAARAAKWSAFFKKIGFDDLP